MSDDLILLPQPRSLDLTGGTYALQSGWRLVLDAPAVQDLLFAGQRLQMALRQHAGVDWALAASEAGPAHEVGVVLWLDPACDLPPQGYVLTITPNTLSVKGRDAAGVFYGVCTLTQVIAQTGDHLPCLISRDHPDFPVRGVMLDISRDKVPAMATLYDLVDRLASWKVNHLQLYTEHTFAYRAHPAVWTDASPMREEEILRLDAYCRRRHVDLVPNQNSFGHMHRWLKHPQYRALAEVDRYETPHWWGTQPFSLCPTDPASLEFLRGLYDELLPNFSSRLFNIGCDETFDLGMGRSRPQVKRRGAGRVYLDYVRALCAEVRARERTPLVWGDIIVKHPALVPELPRDAVLLEWGYEADHPFAEHGALFAQAGIPFYVCPGTSTWNSIAGRTDNALGNLRSAAENGMRYGASGYLITDWGDHGHWQFLPVSYLGFAYGAGVAWCGAANADRDVAPALSRFAFEDAAGVMGRLAYEMGNVYLVAGERLHNASPLVRALQAPFLHSAATLTRASRMPDAGGGPLEAIRALPGVMPASAERAMAAVSAAMRPLGKQRMQRADADLIESEYECAADLLHHACGLVMLAHEDDPKVARPLARRLRRNLHEMVAEYEALWLARNRPGGLRESAGRFDSLLRLYEAF